MIESIIYIISQYTDDLIDIYGVQNNTQIYIDVPMLMTDIIIFSIIFYGLKFIFDLIAYSIKKGVR